jgi:hypothetical protein
MIIVDTGIFWEILVIPVLQILEGYIIQTNALKRFIELKSDFF